MKHIIIEGGDRLGKSTLIEGIANHFDYDNVMIRHFGKPPKEFPEGIDPLSFQAKCFAKEGYLLDNLKQMDNDAFNYYENIVIWNRSHLGEYVYGQMFRDQSPESLELYLKNYEFDYLSNLDDTYLILLTADPEFFLEKEDGKSLSKDIKEKTTELELFDKIFETSIIDNKIKIKVNDGDNYLAKSYIESVALEFIAHHSIL